LYTYVYVDGGLFSSGRTSPAEEKGQVRSVVYSYR